MCRVDFDSNADGGGYGCDCGYSVKKENCRPRHYYQHHCRYRWVGVENPGSNSLAAHLNRDWKDSQLLPFGGMWHQDCSTLALSWRKCGCVHTGCARHLMGLGRHWQTRIWHFQCEEFHDFVDVDSCSHVFESRDQSMAWLGKKGSMFVYFMATDIAYSWVRKQKLNKNKVSKKYKNKNQF